MSLGQFAWLKAGRLANMLNLEELAQIAQEHAQANVPEDEDSQGSEPRRGRGRGRGRGRRAGNFGAFNLACARSRARCGVACPPGSHAVMQV